jgi:lipopolysaccharide export system protein LptC
MNNKRFRNIMIFLCVTGTIMVFSYYQSKSKLRSTIASKAAQEYMTDFTVTNFTETGTLKNILKADSWAYLPTKQYSKLENPTLSVVKSDGLWHVSANHAHAWHKTLEKKPEKFDLWENVIMERPEQNQQEPIIINTEKLTYFPENEYIETDQSITLVKPDLTLTGTGMQGYLNQNLLELKSNVTTYVKTQK